MCLSNDTSLFCKPISFFFLFLCCKIALSLKSSFATAPDFITFLRHHIAQIENQ